MTSVERFETALSGGIPDRVPVVPKIYVDLAARLTGRNLQSIVEEPLEALRVLVEAGKLCGADAVRQFHFPERRTRRIGEHLFEVTRSGEILGRIDMSGGLMTRLEDPKLFDLEDERFVAFNHFWSCSRPLVPDLAAAQKMVVPGKEFYGEYGCDERQRSIVAEVDEQMALIGDCDTATMAFLVTMRGMNQAMFDLVENGPLVHAIMEKGAEIAVERGKFNIDLGMQVLRINDSVGNMSIISPGHWREYVYPHLEQLCTELHAYGPRVKLYCHICGNVLPIVDDLLRAGLDCIAPLDPLGGSSAAKVRKRIGNAAALMGGVNTLSFLDATETRVIEESRRCIEEGGVNGGFVLGSGCVVPPAARLENLEALVKAAEQFGQYENGKLKPATRSN